MTDIEPKEVFWQIGIDLINEYRQQRGLMPIQYLEINAPEVSAFIPAPKPDPLREIAEAWGLHNTVAKSWVEDLRATLDARGLEIREKNDAH